MNAEYETGRFEFVKNRDGVEGAIKFAKQCVTVYLKACKASRKKRGKRFDYRYEFLESAWSFRALIKAEIQKL